MNRDWGLLITLALALLAIAQGLPAALPGMAAAPAVASKSSPVDRSPSANAEDDAARERDARNAANPPPPKCGEGERLIQDYQQLYWPAGSGSGAPRVRYLIALVPDPEESGHTDYFDAVLEGIEEAAAEGAVDFWREPTASASSVRYVRDHHWLPWSGSDKKKRQARCWEQKPGVILYRPAKTCRVGSLECTSDVASHPALVVLLVGETPTWGVRAEVLQAALQTADAPRSATSASGGSSGGALHKHWYRILGPTFSGSAPSLRALLERYVGQRRTSGIPGVEGWAEAPDPAFEAEFRIASGTATGDEVPATLERRLVERASAPSGSPPTPGLQVSYASAVPSYRALLQAMRTFLEQAGGESALLSESGTAYGEQPSGQDSALLLRKFPPNLISLRKAYTSADADEAQPLTRAPAAGAAHAEAQGELSDQTPITHDLALAEVLRELSQGRVRNLGISATDARDVIFIAERVGVQLPDVRLFSIGFDLRYLHPEHAKVLNGLLVAHAAPSLPAQASSMVSQNPLTQRVSAAGQYLLMGRRLDPLARVSLIGNGSIRQIAPDRDAAGEERPAVAVVPRSYWITYVLTLLVLAAGVLLLSGPALLRLLARLPRFQTLPELTTSPAFLRRRGALVSWFRRIDHADLAADDAAASLALVIVLVSAPLMLTPGLAIQSTPASGLAWAGPVSVLLASGVVWLPRARSAALGARAILALVLAVALASLSIGGSPPREVTVWILSGGSPMVGGLVGLAMLLVVAWCWRARLRSLDLLRLGAAPYSRFDASIPPIAQALGHAPGGAVPSAVLALEQRLLRVLRSPWVAAPLLPSLINLAVLASVGAVGLLKPILTFEPGWHHGVLVAIGVLAILPITTCFAHLVVVSAALRELLQSIASPGLLAALASIPRELAFRLESELVHARRGASELQYPVICLGKLAAERPEWAPAAQRCRDALEDQLRFEAGVHFDPTSNPQGLVDELLTVASSLSRERGPTRSQARDLADEYRACLVAIFSARYLQKLRSMVAPVVLGCVLAVLMTSLYFVQPRHLIATATFLWVTTIILAVVATYLALARDAVLSAIGGTVAGSVAFSWGLVVRIAAVTVVPLASFFTSQYPEFVFWVTSLFGNVTQFVQ